MVDLSETKDIANLATGIGALIGAVSLVIGVANARAQQTAQRMEREARTLQLMNERYQKMSERRRVLDHRTRAGETVAPEEAYEFFASYWSMQIDQWEHFRLGVISIEVFVTWMCYLCDSLSGFHRIGPVNSRESWERIGRSLSRNNVEFAILVERLLEVAPLQDEVDPDRPEDTRPSQRLALRAKVRDVITSSPMWITSKNLPSALKRYGGLNVLPRNLPATSSKQNTSS